MTEYLLDEFSLSIFDEDELDKGLEVIVRKLSRESAKAFLDCESFVYAIGNESSAEAINTLLGLNIKAEKKIVKMKEGDGGLIFALKSRLPKSFTKEELEQIGYSFVGVCMFRMEVSERC